ncbi:MAG: glycosyltransferase family 39 protein [Bryobacteraceae bacterium]
MSRGRFWGCAAILLCVMGAVQITSALREVQTADEAVHLVSGYSILRRGAFSLNAENPPVSKVLSALPLLLLNPELPDLKPGDWRDENSVLISAPFLYRNRVPADRLLFYGRLPMILLTLAFGAALAWWAQRRFGTSAALISLFLLCFDPNFIAHGRYVTSDVAGATFYFLATIAWVEFLDSRKRGWLMASAVLSGAGICTKFNLLLLPVLFLVLVWTEVRNGRQKLAQHFAVYLAVVAATIWTFYGFESKTIASDETVARFLNLPPEQLRASSVLPKPAIAMLDPATGAGRPVRWIASHVPLPGYSFLKGLYRLFNHSYWGHRAYLLGHVSNRGWWYYFPVAFLVKTPTGTLLLLLLTAVVAWRGCPRFLWVPPAIYFAVCMLSSIDIGQRHILPVYPFLFVLIGTAIARMQGWRRGVAALGIALLAIESLAIYPNYLAFFNWPSGGSRNGPKYLVDSNIDWGQDVRKLKRYVDERRLAPIPLHYFGSADLDYYGIAREPLENALQAGKRRVAAVSVTSLEMEPGLAQLRRCQPADRIGYSIYVYDLFSPACRLTSGEAYRGP